jgi:PAS domain S-box-containing protein
MSVASSSSDDDPLSQLSLTELRARLRVAEETLAAIQDGEVDAVVVRGASGQQVYTLQNADRPYRAIIEQMQDGAVTVGGDGSIFYCNQRFATMVGLGAEHIMGAQLTRFFSTGGSLALESLSKDPAVRTAAGEFFVLRADGTEVPVNLSLAKVHLEEGSEPIICTVVSDLTSSQSRGHELLATNERLAKEIDERHRAEGSLQLALDAAGMGNWDLDLATGIAHRSRRHDEIFGLAVSPDVWRLDDALARFTPEDRNRVSRAFREAEHTGVIDIEARIARVSDAQICWLRVTGRTFYDDRHRAVRIAGVVADITERRAVEERLRQAQKIEAIGQLTGGVAHDFNNLLQVISGGLQLVARGVTDPERKERILKGMRQAVERGSTLSRQLLAFSRRQTLNPEAIDLKRQIDGMRELLERSLRGDVFVETQFADSLWAVEVDPGQLELVILNLAVNARDAMPDGGKIIIRGENVHHVDETLRGDFVRLDVVDSGTGMPPDVLSHAFEPFFTTKEVGKGSGLGLAQTHGFAQASGGSARIASAPGQGTTVSLFLPRTLKTPAGAAEDSSKRSECRASNVHMGHILLVEDDDEVAALTAEMIAQLGYTTTRVASADAALGALANGREIDLVFSDVMMPGAMNGVGLAQEIRRRRSSLQVLLTSGYAEAAQVAANAQQIKILKKPYTLEDLRAAIAVARREAANAPVVP